MIKNTTHSSIGCNGMANNDDYHGLEMYKNHAKDSTTEGYMQPDPTTMECGHHGMWPNQSLQSQGNAPIETEPMIKNTTHSSIGCNGMANNDDYHGLSMGCFTLYQMFASGTCLRWLCSIPPVCTPVFVLERWTRTLPGACCSAGPNSSVLWLHACVCWTGAISIACLQPACFWPVSQQRFIYFRCNKCHWTCGRVVAAPVFYCK